MKVVARRFDDQALLNVFAENLSDAVLLIDLETRQCHYCNPAALTLSLQLAPAGTPDICHWLMTRIPGEAFLSAQNGQIWKGRVCITGQHGDRSFRVSVLVAGSRASPADWRPALIMFSDVPEDRTLSLELKQAYARLSTSQEMALQSERMAATGRLAAGVAHEINNPIGYVHSNLGTLKDYVTNLIEILGHYERLLGLQEGLSQAAGEMAAMRARLDIDYALQDLPLLLDESLEGISRVRRIVQDLKDFSHSPQNDSWAAADLHRCLESTLNIVSGEIKYKGKLIKQYGELPPVECLSAELSQVFMNLLVNASQAISEQGTITIRTGLEDANAFVEISDDGCGIAAENLPHLFEPFFTTKPVGEGTGLGLSISWGIVAKHNGRIDVASQPGRGASFRVILPLRRQDTAGSNRKA